MRRVFILVSWPQVVFSVVLQHARLQDPLPDADPRGAQGLQSAVRSGKLFSSLILFCSDIEMIQMVTFRFRAKILNGWYSTAVPQDVPRSLVLQCSSM